MASAKRRVVEGGRSQPPVERRANSQGAATGGDHEPVEQTTRDIPAIVVAYQMLEFWAKGFGKLVLSNFRRELGYLGSAEKKEGTSWAQSIASSVFLTSLSSGS